MSGFKGGAGFIGPAVIDRVLVEYPTNTTAIQVYTGDAGSYVEVDLSHISDPAAVLYLYLYTCGMSITPDLSAFTGVVNLDLSGNLLTVSPNISGMANLGTLNLRDNQIVTPPSLAGFTSLTTVYIRNNLLTTAPSVVGSSSILTILLDNNAIPTADINTLLTTIDGFATNNGTIDVSGGTNGAPSGAGATAKTNLIGRGWTVTTN